MEGAGAVKSHLIDGNKKEPLKRLIARGPSKNHQTKTEREGALADRSYGSLAELHRRYRAKYWSKKQRTAFQAAQSKIVQRTVLSDVVLLVGLLHPEHLVG